MTEQEAKTEFEKIRVPFLFSVKEATILSSMLQTAIEQGLEEKEIKDLFHKLNRTTNEAIFSSANFLTKRKWGLL